MIIFAILFTITHSHSVQAELKVAGIVLKWVRNEKDINFKRAEKYIREAAKNGANLIITTESFLDGYSIDDKTLSLNTYRNNSELIPRGKYFHKLTALADELNIYLVAGLLERSYFLWKEFFFNTAIMIGPDGKLVGKYRKQHLEHELFRNTPGFRSKIFKTKIGRFGIVICADRRFANTVKKIADKGIDLLIIPSGGMFGPIQNDPIVQQRSKENHVPAIFVHPAEFLVTNQFGDIINRRILGDRLAIDRDNIQSNQDLNAVFYHEFIF